MISTKLIPKGLFHKYFICSISFKQLYLNFCSLSSTKPLLSSVWRSNFCSESQNHVLMMHIIAHFFPIFLKISKEARMTKSKRGRGGGAGGQSRGWSGGGWGALGDQWCCGIKIKCFCSNSHISCSSWSSSWIYLSFSWWCGIAKSECEYCNSYSISIQFEIIVLQWMNVLLTQYSKISVLKGREKSRRGWERGRRRGWGKG